MRGLLLACCIASAAYAQEAKIRALLPPLGAEAYSTREDAEHALEALVREGGQAAFDVLETTILPDARAGTDFEIRLRVERVVRRLGTWELLWWTKLGPSLWGTPGMTVGGGVVVRTGTCGLDVLDARTGAVAWSVAGQFEKPLPGIAGDVVYANLPPDSVAAYRAGTGAPVWAHGLADLGGDSGRTRMVYRHWNGTLTKEERPVPPEEWADRYLMTLHVPEWNRTLVATQRGHIVALDAKGRRLWHASASGTRPHVAAELRLVFTSGREDGLRLLALDADTGKVVWSVPVDGSGIVGVSNGRLFVTAIPTVDGRIDGRLHAFDARTGERLWTFKPPVPHVSEVPETCEIVSTGTSTIRRGTISHPGDETRIWNAQVVAGGAIVVGAVPAIRFGLRASDGEILWKTPPRGIRLSRAEKDGFVWGASERGEVVGIDPKDGSVVRAIELMQLEAAADAPKVLVQRADLPPTEALGDLSAPVFDGDICYVTTGSGWTIALRIPPFRSRTGK